MKKQNNIPMPDCERPNSDARIFINPTDNPYLFNLAVKSNIKNGMSERWAIRDIITHGVTLQEFEILGEKTSLIEKIKSFFSK